MKKSLIAILFFAIVIGTQGQNIDTALLGNYPSSVVSKVYDVATKVTGYVPEVGITTYGF